MKDNLHSNQNPYTSKPAITLADIIELTDAKLVINEATKLDDAVKSDAVVLGIAPLNTASQQHIGFLANPKYRSDLKNTQALAVFITADMLDSCPIAALVVKDPYLAFAKASHLFAYQPSWQNSLISPHAHIASTARLAEGVQVAAGVVIGEAVRIGAGTRIGVNTLIEDGCTIGAGCDIAANVTIGHHSHLGARVRIHPGTVIGAEGFGFAPVTSASNNRDNDFHWQRIAQLGNVCIGDDVRIGANTCIDRGALDDTTIAHGVIIDNLVQIAHNVRIGAHTAIAACTGIAGSTSIGARCIIGGGVGIAGHLTIVDDVQITGMSMITSSIKAAGSYSSGTGYLPSAKWRRAAVGFRRMAKKTAKVHKNSPQDGAAEIAQLQAQIKDLKNALNHVNSRLQNDTSDAE